MKPASIFSRMTALFVFVLMVSLELKGQEETFIKRAFIEGSIGGTTRKGHSSKYGMQVVFRKDWIGSITRQETIMQLKNLPKDYSPGSGFFIFVPTGDETPRQELTSTDVTAGKMFEVSRSFFGSVQAGIAFTSGNSYTFTRQPVVTENLLLGYSESSNYKTAVEKKDATGGVIKADLVWAFSSFAGVGLGAVANFNSVQSFAGFELKLVLGWMNRRSKD